ncbi:hypothetical protein [Paenibacillus beijingensis]|uniref:hypothetical protein n=1 Tax=Paenibacillus beijingensis TaxID=1126833 RepID=UPI0006962C65|nr:hypothetical protein [Paenibacillus beijingensis]
MSRGNKNKKPNADKERRRKEWIRKANEHFPNEEAAADFGVTKADLSAASERSLGERSFKRRALADIRSAGVSLGWIALLFAVASWFVWPVLLGGTAAVLGFVAFSQGSRGLGIMAMVLGLIAVTIYLILIPLYFLTV